MDSIIKDLEGNYYHQGSSTPLLDQTTTQRKKPLYGVFIFSGVLLVLCIGLLALVVNQNNTYSSDHHHQIPNLEVVHKFNSNIIVSRGVPHGVSEKKFSLFSLEQPSSSYPWDNFLLSWQRTGFHFQPTKNWMNDPNGPLFYKGWYHFFYQYNPHGAVWNDIAWGHAVSKDLINWNHLPIAMVPDHWYDIGGVFTGSATILSDGSIVMIYTGATNNMSQVQNVAYPANLSDPLLINWVKSSANPVLVPPPGIGRQDFRDPSTAWLTPNGNWRFTIGSKINNTGISLVYETKDFVNYKLLNELLHQVPDTGIWECIDFYPVSLTDMNGLDTSVNGNGLSIKHVLKSSFEDVKVDYYALGSYDVNKNLWTPDDPKFDVGTGLRYDYGKFYASKTFYDQNKQRRILWSWTAESDSESTDIMKGWASLQAIPRVVLFDNKTKTNLLQWPVEEVEKLRSNEKEFNNVKLGAGSISTLDVGKAAQLDIITEFEIDKDALEGVMEADVGYNCATSDGASGRNALGPFGLLVLANDGRSEQTAVYFYIAKGTDGNLKIFFCTDLSRSSKATDVSKVIYGGTVPVLDNEKLSVRILVS
ncbi:Acid beta-fructofuranosidase [Thalictrum thalictroides]|uniref:Acid beta-fructofuranosidase n=1 Tax=Thalictrum thalictroides TaxID=46969 RepID=A0A7J6WPZ6_THATH|nr:Acid beta-fructofuranosidase [Thalictrum thalictroides]